MCVFIHAYTYLHVCIVNIHIYTYIYIYMYIHVLFHVVGRALDLGTVRQEAGFKAFKHP